LRSARNEEVPRLPSGSGTQWRDQWTRKSKAHRRTEIGDRATVEVEVDRSKFHPSYAPDGLPKSPPGLPNLMRSQCNNPDAGKQGFPESYK